MTFCFRCCKRKHPMKTYESWSKISILIPMPKREETESTEEKVGACVKRQCSDATKLLSI